MSGEVYVKRPTDNDWVDAFTRYGINLEDGALSALMTPPAIKDYIESNCRVEHGKKVVMKNIKLEARELTLPIHFVAKSREEFLYKYKLFCTEILSSGMFYLKTKYEPSGLTYNSQSIAQPIYKLVYISCTQFRQFDQRVAVFSLKVSEPNPNDRSLS